MGSKKIIGIISVSFLLTMLILTFTARKIHNASLPRVRTASLTYEVFMDSLGKEAGSEHESVTEKTGKGDQSERIASYDIGSYGIPRQIYDNHKVFILSKEMINGEERDIAREVADLVIGRSNDTSYEVIEGLSALDQIIISGQELVQDGCEVYVENE